MGDQSGYADNYCDAMDELASCFEKQGATIVGAWSTDGYEHEDSKSPIAASGSRLLWTCARDVLFSMTGIVGGGNRRKESVKRLSRCSTPPSILSKVRVCLIICTDSAYLLTTSHHIWTLCAEVGPRRQVHRLRLRRGQPAGALGGAREELGRPDQGRGHHHLKPRARDPRSGSESLHRMMVDHACLRSNIGYDSL